MTPYGIPGTGRRAGRARMTPYGRAWYSLATMPWWKPRHCGRGWLWSQIQKPLSPAIW